MRRAGVIGALLGALSLGPAGAADVAAVIEGVRQGVASGAARVDLARSLASDWSRVHVIGPYTPLASLAPPLAGDAAIRRSGIEARDDVALLAFVRGDAVVAVVAMPRGVLDFSPLARRSIARGECVAVEGMGPPRAVAIVACAS